MDNPRQGVAGEHREGGLGASVAPAAEPVGRAGAVGHQRAQLAGRAGRKAVPIRDDRRRDQPPVGAVGAARLDRREYETAAGLAGEIRTPAVILYGPGEPISDGGEAPTG